MCGGPRAGAGRKRKTRELPHRARERFAGRRTPVHVTVRLATGVWNLRSQRGYRCVERALAVERAVGALRIVHYAVLGNHLHLLAEAADAPTLGRRMRAFSVRLAKRINRMMGRPRGRV